MMVRKPRGGSEALLFSLSEFSYILLFLTIGAAALLYGRYEVSEQRAAELTAREAELTARVDELTQEVDFLNDLLDEKRYGVVPCWRRPEGVIPPVAGVITINLSSEFVIERTSCGIRKVVHATYDDRMAVLEGAMSDIFEQDLAYATEKNCYIRVRIENHTGSYHIYSDVLEVLGSLGIIVVNR